MQLTLNQFLLLVLTITAVVAVTFLITLIIQHRKTAKECEETLNEIKSLVRDLKETNIKVNKKIDDLGEIFENSIKTISSLSEIALFLSTKIIRPYSKYWPFLFPLLRLGWRHMKKQKEDKNGK